MKKPPARAQILQSAVFASVVLAALIAQGFFFANVLRWPSTADRGWIAMNQLGPNVVAITRPVGERAGLRAGDVIVRLNGRSYQTFDQLRALLDLEIGHVNRYEIRRGGETLSVEVPNRPLGWERVLRQSGVIFTVGMVFIGLGVLVFLMKPFHGPSWAFFAMCQLLGTMITYFAPSNLYEPDRLNAVVVWVVPLAPAAILSLTALFPERRNAIADSKLLLALPWAVSLGLAAWSRSFGPWMGTMPHGLQLAIWGYAFGSILVFLGSTGLAFARGSSLAVRLRALLVFTGVFIALLIPVVELLANLLLRVSLFPSPILFYSVFLTAFPLAIGYSIVRHDLFEISTVVRRTYGYLLSTAAVVGIYAGVLGGLDLTLGPRNVSDSPLFSAAFIVAIGFLMQPLHRRSQRFVDRLFYRQRYDYRKALRRVSDMITTVLDPGLIHRAIIGSLVNEMQLENGRLLLADPGTGAFHSRFFVGGEELSQAAALDAGAAAAQHLSSQRRALLLQDVEVAPQFESRRAELLRCFEALRSALLLPITYENRLRGVISLGPKKSGRMFTPEDLDVLYTIAGQSAIALENARLFDDLAASLKRIQILESIKTNLSKFVPKAVQALVEESPDGTNVFDKHEEDLTVLFADMTGYTRLSSLLPLGEVNALVERYFGAFLDEILKRGGDVNETAGDGLMVLFRSADPIAHAQAAAEAGLAIQRRCAELNAARGADALPVTMHVGVNSGTCAVGATKIEALGGARWTFTASGPTTNVAARLGALPEAGEGVVVSEATRSRLGERLRLRDLGLQTLKNVQEPVRAWRVEGETIEPPPARSVQPA